MSGGEEKTLRQRRFQLLIRAIEEGDEQDCRDLYRGAFGYSNERLKAIEAAVLSGRAHIVRLFLDAQGQFPQGILHLAPNAEVALLLLERREALQLPDNRHELREGLMPLHAAAAAGRADVCSALLAHKVDVWRRCETGAKRTALSYAAARGHGEAAALLHEAMRALHRGSLRTECALAADAADVDALELLYALEPTIIAPAKQPPAAAAVAAAASLASAAGGRERKRTQGAAATAPAAAPAPAAAAAPPAAAYEDLPAGRRSLVEAAVRGTHGPAAVRWLLEKRADLSELERIPVLHLGTRLWPPAPKKEENKRPPLAWTGGLVADEVIQEEWELRPPSAWQLLEPDIPEVLANDSMLSLHNVPEIQHSRDQLAGCLLIAPGNLVFQHACCGRLGELRRELARADAMRDALLSFGVPAGAARLCARLAGICDRSPKHRPPFRTALQHKYWDCAMELVKRFDPDSCQAMREHGDLEKLMQHILRTNVVSADATRAFLRATGFRPTEEHIQQACHALRADLLSVFGEFGGDLSIPSSHGTVTSMLAVAASNAELAAERAPAMLKFLSTLPAWQEAPLDRWRHAWFVAAALGSPVLLSQLSLDFKSAGVDVNWRKDKRLFDVPGGRLTELSWSDLGVRSDLHDGAGTGVGGTALHAAANGVGGSGGARAADVVSTLLELGCDPLALDDDGCTALHIACVRSKGAEFAHALLRSPKAKAMLAIRDKSGCTPLAMLLWRGPLVLVGLIKPMTALLRTPDDDTKERKAAPMVSGSDSGGAGAGSRAAAPTLSLTAEAGAAAELCQPPGFDHPVSVFDLRALPPRWASTAAAQHSLVTLARKTLDLVALVNVVTALQESRQAFQLQLHKPTALAFQFAALSGAAAAETSATTTPESVRAAAHRALLQLALATPLFRRLPASLAASRTALALPSSSSLSLLSQAFVPLALRLEPAATAVQSACAALRAHGVTLLQPVPTRRADEDDSVARRLDLGTDKQPVAADKWPLVMHRVIEAVEERVPALRVKDWEVKKSVRDIRYLHVELGAGAADRATGFAVPTLDLMQLAAARAVGCRRVVDRAAGAAAATDGKAGDGTAGAPAAVDLDILVQLVELFVDELCASACDDARFLVLELADAEAAGDAALAFGGQRRAPDARAELKRQPAAGAAVTPASDAAAGTADAAPLKLPVADDAASQAATAPLFGKGLKSGSGGRGRGAAASKPARPSGNAVVTLAGRKLDPVERLLQKLTDCLEEYAEAAQTSIAALSTSFGIAPTTPSGLALWTLRAVPGERRLADQMRSAVGEVPLLELCTEYVEAATLAALASRNVAAVSKSFGNSGSAGAGEAAASSAVPAEAAAFPSRFGIDAAASAGTAAAEPSTPFAFILATGAGADASFVLGARGSGSGKPAGSAASPPQAASPSAFGSDSASATSTSSTAVSAVPAFAFDFGTADAAAPSGFSFGFPSAPGGTSATSRPPTASAVSASTSAFDTAPVAFSFDFGAFGASSVLGAGSAAAPASDSAGATTTDKPAHSVFPATAFSFDGAAPFSFSS